MPLPIVVIGIIITVFIVGIIWATQPNHRRAQESEPEE
jgi:hypothetical protein